MTNQEMIDKCAEICGATFEAKTHPDLNDWYLFPNGDRYRASDGYEGDVNFNPLLFERDFFVVLESYCKKTNSMFELEYLDGYKLSIESRDKNAEYPNIFLAKNLKELMPLTIKAICKE